MWFPVLFVLLLTPQGVKPSGGALGEPLSTKAECQDFLAESVADGNDLFKESYLAGRVVVFCIDTTRPAA